MLQKAVWTVIKVYTAGLSTRKNTRRQAFDGPAWKTEKQSRRIEDKKRAPGLWSVSISNDNITYSVGWQKVKFKTLRWFIGPLYVAWIFPVFSLIDFSWNL